MSSVLWDGDNLIQKIGQHVEQLGHIRRDANSDEYVLWLKDTRGVFGPGGTYIRGDTFPSMKDAKQRAAMSVSASLFHYMWLAGLRDRAERPDGAVAQAIADVEDGKPLKESTFKEEMQRLNEHLKDMEADARDSVEKARNREKWYFLAGLSVALIGIRLRCLSHLTGPHPSKPATRPLEP